MFSLLRSAVRSAPAARPLGAALRAYSTPAPGTPPPTAGQPSTPSPASGSGSAPRFDFSQAQQFVPPQSEDPDKWWKAGEFSRRFGCPGNQYTGRSLKVVGGYAATYGRLMSMLNRTGVRAENRRAEFYERPSERKRRLRSERHRRRFQEEVRKRVQLVQMLRSRK